MGKPSTHRCPDCQHPFHSAQAVDRHRELSQGECFELAPRAKQKRILKYRERFGITPPPLPPDPHDFDVIDND